MLLFANFGPVLYRKSKLNVFTRNLRRFKVLKKKNVFGLVVTGLDYESRSPVVYYGIS